MSGRGIFSPLPPAGEGAERSEAGEGLPSERFAFPVLIRRYRATFSPNGGEGKTNRRETNG